jgi:hypothetical protein
MPIASTDIKLRRSQRLTDNTDGGGRMVSTEIVDGVLNNLYDDIDDEDRTTGNVSLRKLFVHVDTANTDTLQGAIAVILDPPEDPLVSMTMFSTGSYGDVRADARNRVESYITRGVESRYVLMGDHYAGSRAISAYCLRDAPTPEVNETLCLSTEASGYTEHVQYVRVESVASRTMQTFIDSQGSFERDVLVIAITTPLLSDFYGQEPTRLTASKPPTRIRSTSVVDAASYFGIRPLTAAADAGALTLDVGTPYVPLVPSTLAETPITDELAGLGTVSLVQSGDAGALAVSSAAEFPAGVGVTRYLGTPFVRGSAVVAIGATTLTDGGDGILSASVASAWRGTADYVGGSVAVYNDGGAGNTAFTVTATPAGVIGTQGYTSRIEIGSGNQQLNYVLALLPVPAPGTVTVDYMALGKWIRLTDNGRGQLVGAPGQGSGTVNYTTGSLVVTVGALPDIDTQLIASYGTGVITSRRDGDTQILAPYLNYMLDHEDIVPGTFSVTWEEGGVDRTAVDNGAGVLTLSGTPIGTIVYRSGEVGFRPTTLPDGGSVLVHSYDWSSASTANLTPVPDSNGFVSFVLPGAPLREGSLRFEWLVSARSSDEPYGAYPVPLKLVARDDGAGNLIGVSAGGAGLSAALGTVNYTTGAVTLKAHDVVVGSFPVPVYTPVPYGTPYRISSYNREPIPSTYTAGTPLIVSWQADSAADTSVVAAAMEMPGVAINLTPVIVDTLVPGSVRFVFRGRTYVDRSGSLFYDVSPTSGAGTYAGSVDYTSGLALINQWVAGGSNTVDIVSLLTRIQEVGTDIVHFRAPGAPLRAGSFTLRANTLDGIQLTATADINGVITGTGVQGVVDWTTSATSVRFGEMVTAAGNEGEPWYLPENVVGGLVWRPLMVVADSVYFGTVIYRSIPMSPVVIGLDPVRLPADGRVVVYKPGQTVLLHNSQEVSLTPTPGQIVNLGRTALSMMEIRDAAAEPIDSVWYTINLDAGTVTFSNPLNLSAYTMPVTIRHMIADRRLVADVQISGQVSLNTGLSRDFPEGSYLSTALRLGEANGSLDLQARVQNLFDQQTWTDVWSDERIGAAADATYNDTDYPLVVTNADAITERWAIEFTSSTAFRLIGETVGQIATGNITADLAPINPRTAAPYFTMDKDGWGGGWSAGNAVRFDTIGALAPVWCARTVLPGPAGASPDGFRLRVLGNITGG